MSLNQAIDAIRKYKGFLFLYHVNQAKSVAPSKYIDHMWYAHISDTELYSVQTGLLFGYYLHHFPFFGKRNTADERDLLEAAEFTKSQALSYFDWDEDDWCGTGRKPRLPRPDADLAELATVIFPGEVNASSGRNQNPDVVTIQAGNFRQTIEYSGLQADSKFSWDIPYSDYFDPSDYIKRIFKVVPNVGVCMPVILDVMKEILVIQQAERLTEISQTLVSTRPTPEGFSRELVNLEVRN